jgi:hypothetical protein
MDEACNYYVTVQSIASLFQIRQNQATKTVKAILGKGCSLLQISVQANGANRSKNSCIALRDFETVALQLAIDAVMDEACNYYVTAQSVASLFQLTPNNATKTVKAILGKGCSLLQISVQANGANRSKNSCIALRDFSPTPKRAIKNKTPRCVRRRGFLL